MSLVFNPVIITDWISLPLTSSTQDVMCQIHEIPTPIQEYNVQLAMWAISETLPLKEKIPEQASSLLITF